MLLPLLSALAALAAPPSFSPAPRFAAVQVSVGHARAWAATTDGGVVCWGAAHGVHPGGAAWRLDGVADAREVVLLGQDLAVRHADGSVRQWGLGDDRGAQAVAGIHAATALARSGGALCAVHSGGAVSCWGHGPWLGAREDARWTATAVPELEGVAALACGDGGCCAETATGLWCAGQGGPPGMPAGDRFARWTGAPGARGLVWGGGRACWPGVGCVGETDDPQGRAAADLARAELLALHHDQRCLTEGAATTCHRQGEAVALPRLVQVDLTDAASCGVDAAGAVWCWGQNAGNVLGSGAPLFDPTPARVAEGATALVAVHGATCIVRDGAWHCTGDGVSSFRELGPAFGGVGSSQYTVFGADGGGLRALASWGTEAEVERLAAPVSRATVAVGDRGTTLYAGGPGGLHAAYSLGEGGQTGWVAMALPPDFGPVAGLASPAVGVCARSAEGAVACWRDDRFDRDDDFVDAPKRTQRLEPVAGLAGAAQLACSQDTVCARLVDGRVRCLGTVDLGGGGLDSPPVELAGLQGATDLAANSFHLCAVVAGEVRCVGNNGCQLRRVI